jgi:hypothetical protein
LALVGAEWSISRSCRLTPRRKRPLYPLDKRLGGPQNRSRQYGEVKNVYLTGTRTPTSEATVSLMKRSMISYFIIIIIIIIIIIHGAE